jgi:hypothetical protein
MENEVIECDEKKDEKYEKRSEMWYLGIKDIEMDE